mmetsp:Transcript_89254/g.158279  ORF Transcript_89254/g.158279 Transcript_89254/m.158279 type:complete len:407 (-) Transcript_89254:184-1404(-)
MSSSSPVDFASGDHYTVLGVARNASEAEIARAYKRMALQHHPDKKGDQAEAKVSFQRIAEAYAILRDAEKRREYDRTGGSQSYVSYDEAEQMWQRFSDSESGPGLAFDTEEQENRKKAIGLIVVLGMLVVAPRSMMQLLPGLTAALVGVALLSRHENSSKFSWMALALLLAGYAAPWAVRVRSSIEGKPLVGARMPAAEAASGAVPVGVPLSGEEVLMSDGRFIRLADPSKRGTGDTSANEGWQQRLIGEMTDAIKSGQEQVVMVFSRQNCPWCDRQYPVLQRAIERRAAGTAPVPDSTQAAAAFLLPGSSSLAAAGMGAPPVGSVLLGPLRIFVLDAAEFAPLAQAFKVEAFPTTIAWGPPGVTPMAAQGFLDDQSFDQLLRTVSMGGPPGAPEGAGRRKRRLFR